jgi:hypothetical protein
MNNCVIGQDTKKASFTEATEQVIGLSLRPNRNRQDFSYFLDFTLRLSLSASAGLALRSFSEGG